MKPFIDSCFHFYLEAEQKKLHFFAFSASSSTSSASAGASVDDDIDSDSDGDDDAGSVSAAHRTHGDGGARMRYPKLAAFATAVLARANVAVVLESVCLLPVYVPCV